MRYYHTIRKNIEFIVVKHRLPGFENELLGIKYREGYGVVAKDSKEHQQLRKIANAITAEYPITFLKNVRAVINAKQISYIWGKAVYQYYLKVTDRAAKRPGTLTKDVGEALCVHLKADGKQCGNESLDCSRYCRMHLQFDPRVKKEFEELPRMPKKEKSAYTKQVIERLRDKAS